LGISRPDALALDKALQVLQDNQKMPYDAYLKIAEKMVAEGNKAGARSTALNKRACRSWLPGRERHGWLRRQK
jgi:hypothetical protein